MDRCAYILESFDRLNVQVDLKSFGCPKHPANCLSNMRSERELTPTRLVKMIYLRPVILINYKSQKIAGINVLDTNSVCNFSFHFLCRFENILLRQNTSSNQTKNPQPQISRLLTGQANTATTQALRRCIAKNYQIVHMYCTYHKHLNMSYMYER